MKLEADTIYRTQFAVSHDNRNLVIRNGTANIYGSNANDRPSALSEMDLATEDTGVRNTKGLPNLPKWIAYEDNTADGADPILVHDNDCVVDKDYRGT